MDMEEHLDNIDEYIEAGDKDGMLKYMRKNNIKPGSFDEDCGRYPIDRAATYGQLNIFNALVDEGFTVEGFEIHPIFEACSNGHLDLVQALVETHGVNPSTPDPYGTTPLMSAVTDKYMDVVKYLIGAGVSVNERISDQINEVENNTILHYAAAFGNNADVCEYLISQGADVEAKDATGNTPLHVAAREDDSDSVIETLLDAGAVVDSRNQAGYTPFLTAAANGHRWKGSSVLRLLLSRGADPEAKDNTGKSALHHVINSHSYTQAYFLMVELNLSPTSLKEVKELFTLALNAKSKNMIQLLVSLGHDPECIDAIYEETNHWAQSEKGKEVIKSMREVSSRPRKLTDLCCFKIRRILGRRVSKVLDSLHVPESIRQYILLKHIREEMEDDEGEEDDEEDVDDDEEVDDEEVDDEEVEDEEEEEEDGDDGDEA